VSGLLIQQGATVACVHGGQATATVANPRVTVDGAPTALLSGVWTVAGCPGVPPSSVPPCATAQWVSGTVRVTSGGQPLVTDTGQAVCTPAGTPLLPLVTQVRVTAA
jgi:hypothetical protein